MDDKVLYFSYGHNTNVSEFLKRIPQAQLLGRATATGYKLHLDHFVDIRPDTKSNVEGVLWLLPVKSIPKLDFIEGNRDHYHHIKLNVHYGDKIYTAFAYQMFKNYYSKKLPSKKYINFIKNGYLQNRIPLSQLINAVQERITSYKTKIK